MTMVIAILRLAGLLLAAAHGRVSCVGRVGGGSRSGTFHEGRPTASEVCIQIMMGRRKVGWMRCSTL